LTAPVCLRPALTVFLPLSAIFLIAIVLTILAMTSPFPRRHAQAA